MVSFGVALVLVGMPLWAQNGPVVETSQGAVQGSSSGGVEAFLGIPFAAPPVGELRWRPPQAPAPWTGERDATEWPPPCPQEADDGTVIGEEDCLYLNVWTPQGAAPGSLPVMFFIHGGGNTQGSSSVVVAGDHLYEGDVLAARGQVVVVTIQYRLGPLGFLVHPALDAESPRGVSGNYGLLDQQAALRWVRDNIAAFGGDPGRVLVFGESAGATDTFMQLVSPLAAGLFSRALMESGGNRAKPLADRAREGRAFAEAAGCPGGEESSPCLRALTAVELVLATGRVDSGGVITGGLVSSYFGPAVDGWVLTEDPGRALSEGRFNHVPYVVGSNGDEMRKYVPELDEAAYEALVRSLLAPWGEAAVERALELYPVGPGGYATPTDAYTALVSDPQFVCPVRRFASAAARSQSEPVYRYFFTHALSGTFYSRYGAFHGLELFFVFQRLGKMTWYIPRTADLELERAVLELWTSFGATGDPTVAGGPSWPAYEPGRDLYLRLDKPLETGDGVRTEKCDFWDSLLPAPPEAPRPPHRPGGRAIPESQ